MKTLVLATLATLAATSAYAGPSYFGVAGEAAYSVENKSVALEVGPDLALGDFSVAPRLYSTIDSSAFTFTGLKVEAEYALTPAVSAFGAVYATDKLNYQDAKFGVRFEF